MATIRIPVGSTVLAAERDGDVDGKATHEPIGDRSADGHCVARSPTGWWRPPVIWMAASVNVAMASTVTVATSALRAGPPDIGLVEEAGLDLGGS